MEGGWGNLDTTSRTIGERHRHHDDVVRAWKREKKIRRLTGCHFFIHAPLRQRQTHAALLKSFENTVFVIRPTEGTLLGKITPPRKPNTESERRLFALQINGRRDAKGSKIEIWWKTDCKSFGTFL